MNSTQILGVLAIVFGIMVIIFPDLIGVLIGAFFILVGINILGFGNKIGRWFKDNQN